MSLVRPTPDAFRDWLTQRGVTFTHNSDGWFKWLNSLTSSTAKTTQDNLFNYLRSLGYTGTTQDMWSAYLRISTGKENFQDAENAYFNSSAAINCQITGTVGGDKVAGVAGTNTRGSAGTYISDSTPTVVEVTGGTARRQYVSATQRYGILYERASTNRLAYAENFDQSGYWTATNITVGTNVSSSPLAGGSALADSLINSGTALGNIAQTYAYGTTVASINWMFSLWIYGSSVTSNLELQLTGDTGGSATGSVTLTAGGWTRISVLGTSLTGTSVTCKFHLGQGTTISSDKFFVWGAQLERQAEPARWPTAYIRNTGSTTASRSVDYLNIATSSVAKMLTTARGTLCAEITPNFSTALCGLGYNPFIFAYANLASSQLIHLKYRGDTGSFQLQVLGSSNNIAHCSTTVSAGSSYRIVAAWDSTAPVYSNGGTDYYLAIYVSQNSGSGWGSYSSPSAFTASTSAFTMAAQDNASTIGYENVFEGWSIDGVISKMLVFQRGLGLAEASHHLGGD